MDIFFPFYFLILKHGLGPLAAICRIWPPSPPSPCCKPLPLWRPANHSQVITKHVEDRRQEKPEDPPLLVESLPSWSVQWPSWMRRCISSSFFSTSVRGQRGQRSNWATNPIQWDVNPSRSMMRSWRQPIITATAAAAMTVDTRMHSEDRRRSNKNQKSYLPCWSSIRQWQRLHSSRSTHQRLGAVSPSRRMALWTNSWHPPPPIILVSSSTNSIRMPTSPHW